MGLPEEYYQALQSKYAQRRNRLLNFLETAGFLCFKPLGAYYIMTDISRFGFSNDVEFVRYLIEEIGVAAVPGSSFYRDSADGSQQVRFCFCKRNETLDEAGHRMQRLQKG